MCLFRRWTVQRSNGNYMVVSTYRDAVSLTLRIRRRTLVLWANYTIVEKKQKIYLCTWVLDFCAHLRIKSALVISSYLRRHALWCHTILTKQGEFFNHEIFWVSALLTSIGGFLTLHNDITISKSTKYKHFIITAPSLLIQCKYINISRCIRAEEIYLQKH